MYTHANSARNLTSTPSHPATTHASPRPALRTGSASPRPGKPTPSEAIIDTGMDQLNLEGHRARTQPVSTPASPNDCSPSPPPSGTTGRSTHP